MTTSHFYFEHTSTKDTDIWVQWLTDDGLGVPNLDQWAAYMDLDQGTSPAVGSPDRPDPHTSAIARGTVHGLTEEPI